MQTKILSIILCFVLAFGFSTTLLAQCEKFENYPNGAEAGKRVHFFFRENIKKKDFSFNLFQRNEI